MSFERARSLADAVLFEGYVLYPYRASSIKNRKRFNFGVLVPRGWSGAAGADASAMRTECALNAPDDATVRVGVRFLHLAERLEGQDAPWHEAFEREVVPPERLVTDLLDGSTRLAVAFPGSSDTEGGVRRRAEAIEALVEVSAVRDESGVVRVAVDIVNTTPIEGGDRDAALLRALVSTHTFIEVEGAEFVSLFDPPEPLRAAASRCRNVGTWPVLVGEPWERDAVLSSPIILYDHPRVAPESPGDLFDATEIDEILTLRTLTLTDEEKRQAAAVDERVRALLARTEGLDARSLARLHGALRRGAGVAFRSGDRVRLRPRGRADVLDLALSGRVATVASVESDFEGRTYLAVTVDDDPGADLGASGLPGHRFFFHPEDVERLP